MSIIDIEQGIGDELKANQGLAAQIGQRVYPTGQLPQNATLPYVSYQRYATTRIRHQGGRSGIAQASFQFDCIAETHLAAVQVADALFDALDEFKGAIGDGTVSVVHCVADDERADWDSPVDATATGLNRIIQDYRIQYHEATGSVTPTPTPTPS